MLISGRAIDGQVAGASLESGGEDERGEIAAVVGVEVSEQDGVELRHFGSAFSESEGTSAAGIDEDTGSAVLPDEIAAGGALVANIGSSGAENLHGNAGGAAGLRGGWQGQGAEEEEREEKPECVGGSFEVHGSRNSGCFAVKVYHSLEYPNW